MQVSAIVLDLDGTLLNSNKEVSPRNMDSVLKCSNYGIPIIIATARPPRTVRDLLPQQLQELGIMIYYNGALVISENLGIKEHYPICPSITSELVHYLNTLGSNPYVSVEVEDKWYSNRELDYSVLMKVNTKPDVIELDDICKFSASKVLISNFNAIDELIEGFGHRANIVVTDSGELIQIMSREVSKENAVANICKRLEISVSNIMVFGDDYNDLGLFKLCGYPIAMGNAVEELKQIAYEVTATNDKDGVAVVLERIHKLCKMAK
jgi:Cof subfamily protein (haloacid dehalogenase superfamily)